MGIFDFVKTAGEKLVGRGESEKEAFQELRKGNVLAQHVRALGLEIDDLKVTYDDGVATITGTCPSQDARERVVLAVGNVAGVAKVDDRITVAREEPTGVFHTVKPGDTLSKLAKKHYGDAMKYQIIFEANRPMLKDPDKIYVGQVLRIPPIEEHAQV